MTTVNVPRVCQIARACAREGARMDPKSGAQDRDFWRIRVATFHALSACTHEQRKDPMSAGNRAREPEKEPKESAHDTPKTAGQKANFEFLPVRW